MVPGETTFSYSAPMLLSYSVWTRAGARSHFSSPFEIRTLTDVLYISRPLSLRARDIFGYFFSPLQRPLSLTLFGAFPFVFSSRSFSFRNVLPSHAIIPRVLSTFVFAETLWRFTDLIFEVFVLLIHPAFYCALNSRKNCISFFFFIYLLSVDLLIFFIYI